MQLFCSFNKPLKNYPTTVNFIKIKTKFIDLKNNFSKRFIQNNFEFFNFKNVFQY